MKKEEKFHKIQILKERLSISMSLAIELINENNGDLLMCEQEFNRNNINTICRLAECNEEVAEKYYKTHNFDVKKSIQKINEQLFYLTTTPEESIGGVGFSLWAENKSLDKYLRSRDKTLFIQTKDFEYVLDVFQSVFPMTDLDSGFTQESFDIVGMNYFDNKTCRIIVEKLAKIKTKDVNVELFLRDLIKWFHIHLRYAEEIIIYGNL